MAAYPRWMSVKYFNEISRQNVIKSLLSKQRCTRILKNFYSSESTGVPLNEPLPNVAVRPRSSPATSLDAVSYETKITTLENGLKVASEESFGQFSTVGGLYHRFVLFFFTWSLHICTYRTIA